MSNVNKELFQKLKRNFDIQKITELINNPSLDINYEDKGQTLLMFASKEGRTDVVELLLSKGANVNDRNSDGRTPIMFASIEGRTDVVKLLLDRSANPNDKDNYGNSPILWASGNGHTEVVKLLLSKGADPNNEDDLKNTPIMLASKKGYLNIVFLLLLNGANKDLTNNAGKTALQLAGNNNKIKNLLSNWKIKMASADLQELIVLSGVDPSLIKNGLPEYMGSGGKKIKKSIKRKSNKNKRKSIKNKKLY
jgi:ankyrin repeat protein